MANPYRDAIGQFASADEMQRDIMTLHQKGDIAGAMKLHQEWMEAIAGKNLHEKALGAEKQEILTQQLYSMVGCSSAGNRVEQWGGHAPVDKEAVAALIKEARSTKLLEAAVSSESALTAREKFDLIEQFNSPHLAADVIKHKGGLKREEELGEKGYLVSEEGKQRAKDALEVLQERFPDDTDDQIEILAHLARRSKTSAEVDYVIDRIPYEDTTSSKAYIEFRPSGGGMRSYKEDVDAVTPAQTYRLLKNIHELTPDTHEFASVHANMFETWKDENQARWGASHMDSILPVAAEPKPEDVKFLKRFKGYSGSPLRAGVQRRVDATASGWAELQQLKERVRTSVDDGRGPSMKEIEDREYQARKYMGEAQILQWVKARL